MDATDLLTTTAGFAEGILGLPPLYDWQIRALLPLEQATGPNAVRTKQSTLTPNEAGKSSVIVATAALWWAAMHKRGKVVISSKSSLQLENQIIPAIERHLHKFGGWHAVRSPRYEVTTPTGGQIIAFVTNDAGRAEGWHKADDIDGPLLIIVDEAKSVDEPIFQAFDRCGYNAIMYTSSPGLMMGRFFDSHTRLAADFHTVRAGLVDCPHIAKAKVDDIIKTYGIDHPFTRSAVFGEFMEQDDANKFVVSLSALIKCLDNPPEHKTGIVAAFCDFAAGGDENVVAVRRGNKVEIAAAWREANKHAAVGRFIMEFRKAGLEADQIWCDASDKEMADLLAGAGWPVHRQNFGAPATNAEMYISWGAEAWHETALSIERCEVILSAQDDTLKAQLTTRQRSINARGKLCLEDKHAMRKRNLPSPDRADAVCGVLAVRDYSALTRPRLDLSAWRDEQDAQENRGVLSGIGADAGY